MLAFAVQAQAATIQYVYDEVGRLIAVIDAGGDTTEYAYDDAGNILSVTRRTVVQVAIVSFSPANGPVATVVTILGSGFDTTPANNTVAFNGVAAMVGAATATQLVTLVPAGATSGPITVANSRGSATSATAFTVTSPQPPVILSFAPSVAAPGDTVTLTGTDFGATIPNNQLRVNQAQATVQSAAVDTLVALVPTASGGKLRLTTPGGSATSTNDLFIAPAPRTAAEIGATGRVAVNGAPTALSLAATKLGLVLFDATLGDSGLRASVYDATFTFGAAISVYKPDGTLLAPAVTFSGPIGSISLPALAEAGTYSLLLVPVSGRSGDASVSVVRDAFGVLAFDTPIDFNVTAQGQQGHFTFQGIAGEKPALIFSDVTLPGGGTFVVRGPDGAIVVGTTAFVATGTSFKMPALPLTGTYTVDVTPAAGTGKVTITLKNLSDIDAGTLAIDVPKVLDFASGGQVARATFAGTAGALLGLSLSNVTLTGTGTVRVTRATDGFPVLSTSFGAGGIALRLSALPTTGNYIVEVTSGGVSAGSATLTVWRDLEGGSIVIDAPAVTVDLPHAGQKATFTFTLTSTEQLGYGLTVTFASGTITLLNAAGGGIYSVSFGSAGIPGTRFPQLAPGTYRIEITPSSNATGSITFKLWRDVDGGLVAPGETRPVAIANPAQQAKFTFTGAAGDEFGYALTDIVGIGSGTITLLNAAGGGLYSVSFGASGVVSARFPRLSAPGTYTVLITPGSNATGTFKFTLWRDVSGGVLDPNATAPTTLQVTHPGQQVTFTFNAVAGDQLGYGLSATFTSGTITLLNAAGGGIYSVSFGSSGIPGTRFPLLSAAGTYTILITPGSSATGSVSFKLWRDVDGGSMVAGQTKAISVPNPAQQAKFTFTAAAGDEFGYAITNLVGLTVGTVTLLNSSGGGIYSVSFGSGGIPSARFPRLSAAGVYTVLVVPTSNGTGSFNFTLWRDASGGLLDPNATTPTTVAIAHPGQQVTFTLNGALGDQFGYGLSATFTSGTITLLNAAGGGLYSVSFGSAGIPGTRFPTLSAAGTYTVLVTAGSNATGSVSFKLWRDVDGGSIAAGETRPVTIPNPAQQAKFTFAGVVGDELGYALTDIVGIGSGTITLLNAAGGGLYSVSFGASGIVSARFPRIAAAGNYTVLITPGSNATGSFKFTLWRDASGGLLDPNAATPTTVAIAHPGQQAIFTLNGAAGDAFGYGLSATFTSGVITLLNAAGGGLYSVSFGSAGIPGTRFPVLSASGTYTVVVTPGSNGTGSVSLKLWRDVDGGSIAAGETRPVTIPNPAQQAKFTFTATAGDQFGYALTGVTFGSGTITVLNSGGGGIYSVSFGSGGIPTARLPIVAPGTYTVLITPNSNATGNAAFTLWKDLTASLAFGTPLDIAIGFAGQQARAIFAGTTGQSLALTLSGVSLPGGSTLQILTPGGGALTSVTFGPAGVTLNIPTLSSSGNYSAVITPASSATGNVTLNLGNQ